MAYTKRTCHNCGYRDIQPNMRQVKIKYKSGSSSAGLSNRAVISSIFGSDSGAKQVQNWLTGKSKRNYHRTRKVWECAGGCGGSSNVVHGIIESLKQLLYSLLWGAVILLGVFIMYAVLS